MRRCHPISSLQQLRGRRGRNPLPALSGCPTTWCSQLQLWTASLSMRRRWVVEVPWLPSAELQGSNPLVVRRRHVCETGFATLLIFCPLAFQRLPPVRCKWLPGVVQHPSAEAKGFGTARAGTARACTACGATTWVEQHPFCRTLCLLSRKGMCGMPPMLIWLSRRQQLAKGLTATAAAANAEHSAHCCHRQAALCPLDRPGMVARWCFPDDLLSGQLLQVGCVLIVQGLQTCSTPSGILPGTLRWPTLQRLQDGLLVCAAYLVQHLLACSPGFTVAAQCRECRLPLSPKSGPLLPGNVVYLFLIFHVLVQHGGFPARGAGRSAE